MYTALMEMNLRPRLYNCEKEYSDYFEHVAIHKKFPEAVLYEILSYSIDENSTNLDLTSYDGSCGYDFTTCAILNGNDNYVYTVLEIMQRKGLKRHPIFTHCLVGDYYMFYKTNKNDYKIDTDVDLNAWHTKILCVMEHIIPKGWFPTIDDFKYFIQRDGVARSIERLRVGIQALKQNLNPTEFVKEVSEALYYHLNYHHYTYLKLGEYIEIASFFVQQGALVPKLPARLSDITNLETYYYLHPYETVVREEAFRRHLVTQMVSVHLPVSFIPEMIVDMTRENILSPFIYPPKYYANI